MFRNPRETALPSVGRPPSPSPPVTLRVTTSSNPVPAPTSVMTTRTSITRSSSTTTPSARRVSPSRTTPAAAKPNNARKVLASIKKGKPKGSILSFFKKAESGDDASGGRVEGLFVLDRNAPSTPGKEGVHLKLGDELSGKEPWTGATDGDALEGLRLNESVTCVKRRKVDQWSPVGLSDAGSPVKDAPVEKACSPPLPDFADQSVEALSTDSREAAPRATQWIGPFLDDSDTDNEAPVSMENSISKPRANRETRIPTEAEEHPEQLTIKPEPSEEPDPIVQQSPLKRAAASYTAVGGFEDFEDGVDFEDDEYPEGEEFLERRWMEEQTRLETAESGFEGDEGDNSLEDANLEPTGKDPILQLAKVGPPTSSTPACPICSADLNGVSDQHASEHVNNCLDGNPSPLPERKHPKEEATVELEQNTSAARFKRPPRPAKPGQENPFTLGGSSSAKGSSAFSKLMSTHAEDAAWATAAAAENAARGRPAYERTCPFYKILPGFFICVDAFRDHYIGLTSTWCHGPIYCSHVTANLVRQQLRVDPKWVVDLDFEAKTEVPGTQGVNVTMIPANHCPGSSLYLFEKTIGAGKPPKLQRVLHCGDFRACQAHVKHPLLRPDVLDVVSGKERQQKLDVCYLDTTYLNPKYAFPSQEEVIRACADMCVSLNKDHSSPTIKEEQVNEGDDTNDTNDMRITANGRLGSGKTRGKLLVIVGTYSIGKERICLGIARALNSKIYAPPGKQRICVALEDPELNARLTRDPREAQVHMTPLFEIRAETLDDYLKDYSDTFERAVGFRPSGWNYRPPNSRFVESPAVQTVLHSGNWKSNYSMKDLVPQRGSTSRASCFGVPYSEHSSFRELTMFCCALRIDKIIPTVNVGSAKSRERMKSWCERWANEKKKNGLFKIGKGKGEGSW
ncbi:hypothetical protein B0A49_11085 [Cryomyces minteri]|uniref:DNA repair metallo-beta-lactamase domain-containing protein n=1 Tax=Cryomyces minteri TaxID=331657 RepID=A0A4U0WE24_9PEZI|nr:hypothetical protein B0A49_11085 [Cryomyces minteri]